MGVYCVAALRKALNARPVTVWPLGLVVEWLVRMWLFLPGSLPPASGLQDDQEIHLSGYLEGEQNLGLRCPCALCLTRLLVSLRLWA